MHQVHKIKKIIRETPVSQTYIFEGKIEYKPGQFIMMWLPGTDEKPFAVSYIGKDEFGVTIECKGIFTKKVCGIPIGTKVGIRGPYGHGFELRNDSIIVAGGLGMAPAFPLIKEIKNSTIIQGAKSKEFLLYLKNPNVLKLIDKNNNKIVYCTDDGSFGIKGFTSQVLNELISKKTETVFTCGPEIMIKKIFEICEKNKVECQASLERYIRCGFGICGACVCGDQLVCKDGPVFKSEQLRKMKDFGKFARLKSGKKVPLEDYFSYRNK
jgi:dihydroorotate dehydrogenase electron transfer subunit